MRAAASAGRRITRGLRLARRNHGGEMRTPSARGASPSARRRSRRRTTGDGRGNRGLPASDCAKRQPCSGSPASGGASRAANGRLRSSPAPAARAWSARRAAGAATTVGKCSALDADSHPHPPAWRSRRRTTRCWRERAALAMGRVEAREGREAHEFRGFSASWHGPPA